jgi:hypothetical protein
VKSTVFGFFFENCVTLCVFFSRCYCRSSGVDIEKLFEEREKEEANMSPEQSRAIETAVKVFFVLVRFFVFVCVDVFGLVV